MVFKCCKVSSCDSLKNLFKVMVPDSVIPDKKIKQDT